MKNEFWYLKQTIKKDSAFIYSFFFTSLIAPFLSNNLKLLFFKTDWNKKKILLKNSYVILTWFYYISFLQFDEFYRPVQFFVLPTRRQVFTFTKAPIAHKLWSKEQYMFQLFKIKISFFSTIDSDFDFCSFNQGLLFVFILKKTMPNFTSNLMFLKKKQISFSLTEKFFFIF